MRLLIISIILTSVLFNLTCETLILWPKEKKGNNLRLELDKELENFKKNSDLLAVKRRVKRQENHTIDPNAAENGTNILNILAFKRNAGGKSQQILKDGIGRHEVDDIEELTTEPPKGLPKPNLAMKFYSVTLPLMLAVIITMIICYFVLAPKGFLCKRIYPLPKVPRRRLPSCFV